MSDIQKYVPADVGSNKEFESAAKSLHFAWDRTGVDRLLAAANAHTAAECEKAVGHTRAIAIERGDMVIKANARIAELNEVANSAYRQAAAERLRADDGWARYEAKNKQFNDLEENIVEKKHIHATTQSMADCMDMVRQELIQAGVIDKSVMPMFVADAVCSKIVSLTQTRPAHETIVREGANLVCTACGTTAAQKVLTDAQIKEIFLTNGFTIKEGNDDLKPYVYAAAHALLAAERAQ